MKRLNLEELRDEKAVEYAVRVANRYEALENLSEERTPEVLWQSLQSVLLEEADKTVGYVGKKQWNTWITDDTRKLIQDKREAKQRDQVRYKELKTEVQRKVRADKQKQLDGMCDELEAAQQKGNMQKLYQTAKSITRKFQLRLNCIKAKNGEVITETNEIAERWQEYCEELYDNTSTGQERYERWDSTQEPPPTEV